jgi:hypothetical protein
MGTFTKFCAKNVLCKKVTKLPDLTVLPLLVYTRVNRHHVIGICGRYEAPPYR